MHVALTEQKGFIPEVPPEEHANPNAWALLIGIDEYQALSSLEYCAEDAKALEDTLENLGYPEKQTIALHTGANQSSCQPTGGTIRRRVKQFVDLTEPDDKLLFFFSGHGVTRNGQGYLVASDQDRQGGIPFSWVKSQIRKSESKQKVMMMDACHVSPVIRNFLIVVI